LLDVGCSAGWFMSVAEAGGWKATGFDVSAGSVAHCKARGYDARVATLDEHDLPAGSFDVVAMFDSIEHMPSPMAALRAAHALLADDGIVMITTPNIDGLFPRLTYQLFGRTFGAWEHPTPPGHIFQFGKKTLAAALDRTGFTMLHEKTEAIALDHTVGELEDALMEVLKGRNRRPDAATATADGDAPPVPPKTPPAADPKVRLMRRAVRQTVRTAAWALVGGLAAPAPLVGAGDSLVVIARKRS
jgi:SAM-dependent methyltransferase